MRICLYGVFVLVACFYCITNVTAELHNKALFSLKPDFEERVLNNLTAGENVKSKIEEEFKDKGLLISKEAFFLEVNSNKNEWCFLIDRRPYLIKKENDKGEINVYHHNDKASFDLIICVDVSDSSDETQTKEILQYIKDNELQSGDRILILSFATWMKPVFCYETNKKDDKNGSIINCTWPKMWVKGNNSGKEEKELSDCITEIYSSFDNQKDTADSDSNFCRWTDIHYLMKNLKIYLEEFYKDKDNINWHARRAVVIISDGVHDPSKEFQKKYLKNGEQGDLKEEDLEFKLNHDDVKLGIQITLIKTTYRKGQKDSKKVESDKIWEKRVKEKEGWVEILEAEGLIKNYESVKPILNRTPRQIFLKPLTEDEKVQLQPTRREPYLGYMKLEYKNTYEKSVDLCTDTEYSPLRLCGDELAILWHQLFIDGTGVDTGDDGYKAYRELIPKQGTAEAVFCTTKRDMVELIGKKFDEVLHGNSLEYNINIHDQKNQVNVDKSEADVKAIRPFVVFGFLKNAKLKFKLDNKENKNLRVITDEGIHEFYTNEGYKSYEYPIKNEKDDASLFKRIFFIQVFEKDMKLVKHEEKYNYP